MRAHVKELVSAFQQRDVISESQNASATKSRWATNSNHYQAINFERQAWRILNDMLDLHRGGWRHRIEDTVLRESILRSKDLTFRQRWDDIVTLLSRSKRTCDDVLKGEKTKPVLGEAAVLIGRIKNNKNSNDKKAEKLRLVKAMKSAGLDQLISTEEQAAPPSTTLPASASPVPSTGHNQISGPIPGHGQADSASNLQLTPNMRQNPLPVQPVSQATPDSGSRKRPRNQGDDGTEEDEASNTGGSPNSAKRPRMTGEY
jgi:hypothetical protein